MEELDLQLALKIADGLAERRLFDPETLGGPREVQLFGNGDKVTKVSQLHS